MPVLRDSFIDLERYRRYLEEQVEKLLESLDEWRQWKTEYEALQLKMQSLPSEAPQHALTAIRESFEGELVIEKELVEIFGKNDSKKRDQVISILSNRVDYISRIIETLSRRLETAENKLVTANVVSDPGGTDEDGLPITEIMEVLDDDDNVVSFSLRRPGDSEPQFLAAIEKAGFEDLRPFKCNSSPSAPMPPAEGETREAEVEDVPAIIPTDEASQPEAPEAPPMLKKKKKGVTFSADTKAGEDEIPVEHEVDTVMTPQVEAIMRQAKDQEKIISEPLIPEDDSLEDAQLRREMLQYNLSELNPVVAELTLEEGSLSESEWDTDEHSNYDDDDDDADDEDKWGRSTKSVMSDEYRQRMMEISERLEREMRRHVGSDPEENAVGGIGHIRVKANESTEPKSTVVGEITSVDVQPTPYKSANGLKKGVRFAPTIDVAEETAAVPLKPPAPVPHPKKPEIAPLSDVVERKAFSSISTQHAPTKTSRFKLGRNGEAPVCLLAPELSVTPSSTSSVIPPHRPLTDRSVAPSGPEGRVLATGLVERASKMTPTEPDELDAGLLQQEVAVEYHKRRNKLIHQQGGFMKEDQSVIQPLDEEEGGPPRMSRFKAARLSRA